MSEVDRLRDQLRQETEVILGRTWNCDTAIDSAVEALKARQREGLAPPVKDQQEEAIARFRQSLRFDTLRDARLVSYGIAMRIGVSRKCLLEDDRAFPAVLNGVDEFVDKPVRYRRCYQGLLSGYFEYDVLEPSTTTTAHQNWHRLRNYLGERIAQTTAPNSNPAWVTALEPNHSLFSEDPCGQYASLLLDGQAAVVDELRETLSIPGSSWFTQRLLLAMCRTAASRSDGEFMSLLPSLLESLARNPTVQDEGLGLMLDRYAAIQGAESFSPLRDHAVRHWGNPWLPSNSMRWGRVSAKARTMVADWLKLEFIESFFTLLAEEGESDKRRLQFWKRYVHAIEKVYIALGADARDSRSPDFVALRKKMHGLTTRLNDSMRSNNAFIMLMGRIAVVEFGSYSNACYGYDTTRPLPFDVSQPVVTPVDARNSLKHSQHLMKLRHQDGIHGWLRWEEMFEATLAGHFGIGPTRAKVKLSQSPVHSAASTTSNNSSRAKSPIDHWTHKPFSLRALSEMAHSLNLTIEDLTGVNGNLWIRADDSDPLLAALLQRWGFRYKATKGWWKQD